MVIACFGNYPVSVGIKGYHAVSLSVCSSLPSSSIAYPGEIFLKSMGFLIAFEGENMKYQKIGLICLAALLVAAPARANARTDREKFLKFYRAVMWHAEVIDNLYNPLNDTASKGNIFIIYRIALSIEGPIYQQARAIKNTKAPALSNASAEAILKSAKDSLATAYFYEAIALGKVIKSFDVLTWKDTTEALGSAKEDFAVAQERANKFQLFEIMSAARFQDAASMLGVKPDELREIAKQIKARYARLRNHKRRLAK